MIIARRREPAKSRTNSRAELSFQVFQWHAQRSNDSLSLSLSFLMAVDRRFLDRQKYTHTHQRGEIESAAAPRGPVAKVINDLCPYPALFFFLLTAIRPTASSTTWNRPSAPRSAARTTG